MGVHSADARLIPGTAFPELEREDERRHVGETGEYDTESDRSG